VAKKKRAKQASEGDEDAADRKIKDAIAQARAEREKAERPTHRRAGPLIAALAVLGSAAGALVWFHLYTWLLVLGIGGGLGGILFKLVGDTPPHGDASGD
jgi:hypothetical protein